MKFIFALLVLFFAKVNSQILSHYPAGQHPYVGGNEQFYHDFHRILMATKKKPCENKDELYHLRVVIYPDSTISFVKDENPEVVEKNKCAHLLARDVASYLKGWNPAVENGEKVATLASFLIFPDDLFDNYTEGYDSASRFSIPQFQGGLNRFRAMAANRINIAALGRGKQSAVAVFTVNEQGKITDVTVEEPQKNRQLNKMVIDAISSINNPWIPAKFRGLPKSYIFKLPFSYESEE